MGVRRGGAGGLAALPMYDRPELAAETDAFWAALREAIRDRGLDAPETLTRNRPPRLVWSAPELVLAQTCGLPYVSALARRVGLVGTPSYALDGVGPGQYRSALVVAEQNPATDLAGLRGAVAAINARDSQSGYAALMHAAAPHAVNGRFFSEAVITGSHAASIQAVAGGRAHLAAIDAVSWALAERFDRATGRLRVLAWTDPVPGLPLITGSPRKAAAVAEAAAEAIGALAATTRSALLLTGFARTAPKDYVVIRDRLAAAHTRHRLPGPAY